MIERLTREEAVALEGRLLDLLGLDPRNVSAEGMTAEYVGGTSPVVIRWEGVATLTVTEWEALRAPLLET